PEKNSLLEPESLTAAAWLEKWKRTPDDDAFKHPFEPRTWPPQATNKMLTIRFQRNRKLMLDPLCAPPIYLGHLAEGKTAVLNKLESLTPPSYMHICPDDVALTAEEQEQLHPAGYSVRYLALSKMRMQM
ncbi:MAG: hypothetical protein GY943_12535, partial [Chloroflexi bacterium]|nr:hypothetical protein [Chloroflexota bacterium]